MHAYNDLRNQNSNNGQSLASSRSKHPMTAARKLQRLFLSAFLLTAATSATPAFASLAAPSKPNLTDASDSGSSSTDNLTNVKQPTFSGTGIPFSVVNLFSGSTKIGVGIVPPSGQWLVGANIKLVDGPQDIRATQTLGGVQSALSNPLTITIDTVAPTTTKPDLTPGSDSGSSNSDNYTNITTPTLSGTGTPNCTVLLYNTALSSQISIGSGIISAQGAWTAKVTYPLPAGPGTKAATMGVRAFDKAGNASPLMAALAISVDTVAPATPGAPDLIASCDSGPSNTDNHTNVTIPIFTVKTEPYTQVQVWGISDVSILIGTAVSDQNGNATVTATKPLSKPYSVWAQATDKSGNKAASISAVLSLYINTKAPLASMAPSLASQSDSGTKGDKITNITKPVLSGFFTSNTDAKFVNLDYFAGIFHYSAKATVTGTSWTVTSPNLPDGVYDVVASNSDLYGNVGSSSPLKLTIDTMAPAAPPAPDLAFYSDAGISETDDITSDDSVEFYGKSPIGLPISIFNHGALVSTSYPDNSGEWLAKVTLTQPGKFSFTASTVDAAGNASNISPALVGLFDVAQPTSTLTAPSTGAAQDLNAFAGTSQDPLVNGLASGVDKVGFKLHRYSDDSYWSGTAWNASPDDQLPTTLNNNKWSKTTGLPTNVTDGLYQVILFTSDVAGNQSSVGFVIDVDNVLPTVDITAPGSGQFLETLTDISGIATDHSAGAAVDISSGIAQVKIRLQRKRNNVTTYWNGTAFTTTVSTVAATVTTVGERDVTWKWTKQMPTTADLDNGTYTLYAYSYDMAGNSKTSTARNFTFAGGNVRTPVMGASAGQS